MKSEDLYELLGEIDEKAVHQAETPPIRKRRFTWIKYAVGTAAAACIAMASAAVIMKFYSSPQVQISDEIIEAKNMVLAEAVYPDMPDYPYGDETTDMALYEQWSEMKRELCDQPEGYADSYCRFFTDTVQTFLSFENSSNSVYSPMSLYLELGMTAEISDGDTREQILDLLAQKDIETLRSNSKSIWERNYSDDGMAKCILANSLWTNSSGDYKKSAVDSLLSNYYASSFSGDPGTKEYNKLLQDWLNKQTDGLLSGYVDNIKMDADMMLTLASTVNYSGKWIVPFYDKKSDTFHTPVGDVQCDMIYSNQFGEYCWGEDFSAVDIPMEENGCMRIILPDENVTTEQLLDNEQVKEFMLTSNSDFNNHKYVEQEIYLPKFDISDSIDMKDGLEQLGVTDMFDTDKADLSPLIANAEGTAISRIEQDTRVTIDEQGCKASSLTVEVGSGAGMPEDTVTFRADRPFIFEIASSSGLPLFVGIVNDPSN